jgi:hypothetical protein
MVLDTLNRSIYKAHYQHYDVESSFSKLIDKSKSPNANLIYHLYSNGEITFQKGGWAYLERSEFNAMPKIEGYEILNLTFPMVASNGLTYAILTEQDCYYYREEMKKNIVNQN